MKKIGVARFLGTNCDKDLFDALDELGAKVSWLWYQDRFNINDFDAVAIPGGFSYGDYLRSGALAAKSPVMDSIEELSKLGKPVLGICNGFQILCERKMLPGALLRNQNLKFIDRWVELENITSNQNWKTEKSYKLPIAHADGRFYADLNTLKEMQDNDQIWLKYKNNPNGSVDNIAGVLNKNKNVAAMMPHPERAIYEWTGGTEGRQVLERLFI